MKNTLMLLALACTLTTLAAAQQPAFTAAKPIWPQGKELDLNLTTGIRAVFDKPETGDVTLRVTASSVYRAWVNGAFAGYGPARGPKGWHRVDEWNITPLLRPGKNVVAVEAAGYNTNSYYLFDQPSFIQAEVIAGAAVLAATGAEPPFQARLLTERIQKVERYSFQRPYAEAYRLTPGYDAWRRDPAAPFASEPMAVCEPKQLLPRGVTMPDFGLRPALNIIATGSTKEEDHKPQSMTKVGKDMKGFAEDQIEAWPSVEMRNRPTSDITKKIAPLEPAAALQLPAGGFAVLDLGVNYSGFIGATITCEKPTRLLIAFDEILTDAADVDARRLGCVNVISCDLAPGTYDFESFEPYTCRYLKLLPDAACTVNNVHIRRYANAETTAAKFNAPDERLNRLFTAGIETYAQNAVDVFMDCPHRERAGWLCDSFFTARVAKDLSGYTRVEKNFYENFLMPESFERLPKGMLPMCYPSDHYNGIFIPNWAMWFVVQLEEYLARSGDRETVDKLQPKVMALIDYFKPFKNSDGLLEKLESWVFVEWSKANDFVQDVNYPSNMLYAGMLAAAGRMYNIPSLAQEAEAVKQSIRAQAFDGEFFIDNALRKDGKLNVTSNHSEVCQYFAFFFDVATPQTHAKLWDTLCTEFGPKRSETKAFQQVHPANSFIGNMLRVEILSRAGRCQQILDESFDYLLYMVDRTGTLWENTTPTASCNHGFASHIVHTLYRDILGVYSIDTVNKRIVYRFSDVNLPACSGEIPTPDGPVTLSWTKEGNTLTVQHAEPAGYQVEIQNAGGLVLK